MTGDPARRPLPDYRIYCSYDTATPDVWRLERDYTRITSIGPVTVPANFLWDGASIPREFWAILPPWSNYSGAALIHDWFYSAQPRWTTRKETDRVFYELMREDGVPKFQAKVMWQAVRRFGPRWHARDFRPEPTA